MPIIQSSPETLERDIAAAPEGKPVFVIFSSKTMDNGVQWCWYCQVIQPHVDSVFRYGDAYGIEVLFTGPELRDFKATPGSKRFYLIGIPTICRLEDGEVVAQGGYREDDVAGHLEAFAHPDPDYEDQYLAEKAKGKPTPDRAQRWEETKQDYTEFMERKAKKEEADRKWAEMKAKRKAAAAARKAKKEKEALEAAKENITCKDGVCTLVETPENIKAKAASRKKKSPSPKPIAINQVTGAPLRRSTRVRS